MTKWNDDNIIEELKKIIEDIGHFPSQNELIRLKRIDLIGGINKSGGLIKFRLLFDYNPIHKLKGYWNKDTVIDEINLMIKQLGHFPSNRELTKIHRSDLVCAVQKNGGFVYFRKLMGHELAQKQPMYWTKENTINELESVISRLNHFPTHKELILLERNDLSNAIIKNGGSFEFGKILNYDITQKPVGYWSDKTIIKELKLLIDEIGFFPTMEKVLLMNSSLYSAIATYGGINKFRKLLGYEPVYKPDGYWTEELVIQELQKIVKDIGHFPSQDELMFMDRNDLFGAITNNGGFLKFHNLLGYTSIQEKYKSELCSYTYKRGKSTENIVKQILLDYSSLHPLPSLQLNQKLSPGHILEFVCNTGKTIGIDVTNTESKNIISHKYRKKSYHLYLDELWIVVFSDVFTEKDYFKFNEESPDNVKVFSIYGFLDELDYSLDEHTKSKIDKYCSCTFHTKEELKNKSSV